MGCVGSHPGMGHDGAMLTVLLPPSEGKAPGGSGAGWDPASGRFGRLADERRSVAKALVEADGGTEKMLGARGELLDRARAANRTVIGAPTLPAWRRFTGVVWTALDPRSLPADAKRRSRSSVVVVSALAGLTAWSDPVPDFRLKLSAKAPGVGRLDVFWREPLSAVLNRHLARRTVVDLLPNEHRAAWLPDPSRYRLLRPHITTVNGAPGGHFAKAAKGALARALLLDEDTDRVLATFDPGPLFHLDVETVTPG